MIDINKDLITVSWKPPKSDGGSPVTGYSIGVRSSRNTEFENVGKVDAKTTTFTVGDLEEGSRYFVKVEAENPAGLGDAVELRSAVTTKLKEGL